MHGECCPACRHTTWSYNLRRAPPSYKWVHKYAQWRWWHMHPHVHTHKHVHTHTYTHPHPHMHTCHTHMHIHTLTHILPTLLEPTLPAQKKKFRLQQVAMQTTCTMHSNSFLHCHVKMYCTVLHAQYCIVRTATKPSHVQLNASRPFAYSTLLGGFLYEPLSAPCRVQIGGEPGYGGRGPFSRH